MALCPDPTLWYCPESPWEQCEALRAHRAHRDLPTQEAEHHSSAQAVEHGSHQGFHQYFPPQRREGPEQSSVPSTVPSLSPVGRTGPHALQVPLLLPCSQWSWFCSVRM